MLFILTFFAGLVFSLFWMAGTGAGQDGIEGKEPGDSLDLDVLEGSGVSGGEGMLDCWRWFFVRNVCRHGLFYSNELTIFKGRLRT